MNATDWIIWTTVVALAIAVFMKLVFAKLRTKKQLLFLGLDNSGKTTLIRLLTTDLLANPQPSTRPSIAEFVVNNVSFKIWDLGACRQSISVQEQYWNAADAIVFFVDASDAARLSEAGAELNRLLASKALAKRPFLILGNKIDKVGCLSANELSEALGLTGLTGKEGKPLEAGRPMELFMCSAAQRRGYGEGFRWLLTYL